VNASAAELKAEVLLVKSETVVHVNTQMQAVKDEMFAHFGTQIQTMKDELRGDIQEINQRSLRMEARLQDIIAR
jgi:hypothetical protein